MVEKRYRLTRINHTNVRKQLEERIYVAHSQAELKLFLATQRCACGGELKTLRRYRSQVEGKASREPSRQTLDRYVCTCRSCRREVQLGFDVSIALTPQANQPYVLNPTTRPSDLLDAGQWLNLAYAYFEASLEAEMEEDPRSQHDLARTAVAALDEALKFYPEGRDLPPPESFLQADSRRAFVSQPEMYRRSRLRELREVYRAEAEKASGGKSHLDELLERLVGDGRKKRREREESE